VVWLDEDRYYPSHKKPLKKRQDLNKRRKKETGKINGEGERGKRKGRWWEQPCSLSKVPPPIG
jgi:hypothetical protein